MAENNIRRTSGDGPGEADGQINKKLLLAAVVAGVVAVGLFIAYDSAKEKELAGDTVTVLKWTRDLKSGEEISPNDFAEVEIRRKEYNSQGKVLTRDDRHLLGGNAQVNHAVSRDEYIRYSQLLRTDRDSPSTNIRKGYLGVSLPVDPAYTPGGLLQVNDRADLIGLFSIKGQPAKAYVLIQNLRVVAIGGRSDSPEDRPGASAARDNAGRVYRSFTVELKPEVAVQLADLMPRIEGKVWLAVRNPADNQAQFDNRLNPEVEALLVSPAPAKPGQ